MDEYKPLEEMGSTAEDFLRPNISFPKYQYSVFLGENRDEQLVVRASTFDELLAGKRNIQLAMKGEKAQHEINYTDPFTDYSEVQSNGNSNNYADGEGMCDLHEAEIFTVKKESPNKGRQFKSCVKCRKFLGFV